MNTPLLLEVQERLAHGITFLSLTTTILSSNQCNVCRQQYQLYEQGFPIATPCEWQYPGDWTSLTQLTSMENTTMISGGLLKPIKCLYYLNGLELQCWRMSYLATSNINRQLGPHITLTLSNTNYSHKYNCTIQLSHRTLQSFAVGVGAAWIILSLFVI